MLNINKTTPLTSGLLIFILCLTSSLFAQKKQEKKLVLKTQMDSLSYAIGSLVGADLKEGGFKQMNYDILSIAMQKAINGDSLIMNRQEATMALQSFAMAAMKKKAAENEKIVSAFMDNNKKEPGIISTESGLQYKIIKAGSGSKPAAGQKVKVHYTGKFIDGKVFDSSVERGEPVVFGVTDVIKGWTEGLQLMNVGSKWILYVPPTLGYGEQGNERIPGNSILVFEVELLGIE